MTFLEIERAGPMNGSLMVQGSKNTVLPILAASLLNPGTTILYHVPKIRDAESMIELMRWIGCNIQWSDDTLKIDAAHINCSELIPEITKSMRCSVNLIAPLLARCGRAVLYEPGGCSLGKRPIDLHIHALEALGAQFAFCDDRIEVKAKCLREAEIALRFPSVGATQQALTAAASINGVCRLINCAREPEVTELCLFLEKMGAEIDGIGGSELTVRGIKNFKPVAYRICADRIVTATYMSAAAVCGGSIRLDGVCREHLTGIIEPFMQMGCEVEFDRTGMRIARDHPLKPISYIETMPYPGFPTDVQSLLLSVLTQADGHSVVKEKVFDARFRTAYQLQKMGADIIIENNCAVVAGSHLRGCRVEAPDLRGGAALAVAALAADGITRIFGYEHIKRGYADIAGDLRKLGAKKSCLIDR